MKAREMKYNEKTIELLDGKHKIAIDFNAFEELGNIYGDMQNAFSKFTGGQIKFNDIKNFLCAGINSCIEDTEDKYTPFEIGKLLDLSKIEKYMDVLMELMNNAMPTLKKVDEDKDEKN